MFELIGKGAAPDLSETQAFKNLSLQMMIDRTFTFRNKFHKQLYTFKFWTFDMNSQSGSGTLLPLPASASTKSCRFHASASKFLVIYYTFLSNYARIIPRLCGKY